MRAFPLHIFLTFAIFLSVHAYSATSSCAEALRGIDALSDAQKQSLVRANEGRYSVRILENVKGLTKKVVVILGEEHIKNQRDALRGMAVIEAFPFRGIEFVSESYLRRFWFSKALYASIVRLYQLAQRVLQTSDETTIGVSINHYIASAAAYQLGIGSMTESALEAAIRVKDFDSFCDLPASLPRSERVTMDSSLIVEEFRAMAQKIEVPVKPNLWCIWNRMYGRL